MKKNKDTFSTYPQYSMGTMLSEPQDFNEVIKNHFRKLSEYWEEDTCSLWYHGYLQMDRSLNKYTDAIDLSVGRWRVVPVWGKIPEGQFWYYLSRCCFPMNQQLRHKSEMKYCVLRDYVHDRGHLPPLHNEEYSDTMISMGILGQLLKGNEEALTALSRFYWATIEFSLMLSDDFGRKDPKPKALGAGIISSKEELELAVSNSNNTQREFNFQEIIEWDYDPYGIQDRHYVIEDWKQVKEGIVEFYKRYL